MTDWQIDSLLLALHNIAQAAGYVAYFAGLFFMGKVWSWTVKQK